jgi:hypothetical protein
MAGLPITLKDKHEVNIMAETKQKEQIYVTHYKGVELVHTPMGLKDTQGNKRRSIRCNFIATEYGYAFVTSDPMLIEWLDAHEYMTKGKISKFDPKSVTPVKPVEVANKVTSGTKDEPLPDAPKGDDAKPRPVTIRR